MAAPDLPPLNALRAFEAAARLGSLSRAAGELHVTHGAISRQVRLLEEELGVALFHRDGRRLRLTEAGRRLAEATGSAFAGIRSTVRGLRRGGEPGTRVIGCPGSLLARWFIPRLDRLHRALPELRLQLSASEGEQDPRRAGLDALLWYAEPPWPADFVVYELAPESLGPVFSPHYADAEQLCQAPPEAVLEQAVLHTASRPQAWPVWLRSQGLEPERLRLGQGFEHLYYLLEAALAGLGVAIAPRQLVADDLAAGRLLAPWGFVETSARLALWVPRRRLDSRAERLAQWLRGELA